MNKWVTLVIGIFCGGLGGSIFTWYMNHPRQTTVAYSVSTAVAGAPDSTARVLIPNLHLKIGDEDVAAIYIHTVQLTTVSGPQITDLPIGIFFARKVNIYGSAWAPPSPLHHIECGFSEIGKTCTGGPFSNQAPNTFKIVIASDTGETPSITTTNDSVVLTPLSTYATQQSSPDSIYKYALFSLSFVITVFGFLNIWIQLRTGKTLANTSNELDTTIKKLDYTEKVQDAAIKLLRDWQEKLKG